MFQTGAGLLNNLINKLPFELHIPGGYQYCGPGTHLQKRLKRGDPGINPLDRACKQHDIAYSQHRDLSARHLADKELRDKAWQRVKSQDASIGEKAAALLVSGAMAAKSKFGMGCQNVMTKRKKKSPKRGSQRRGGSLPAFLPLLSLVRQIGQVLFKKNKQGSGLEAVKVARRLVKEAGGRKKIRVPRMIPLPKTGGFLPFLLPLFAGLSAIGALGGGASAIARTVSDIKNKAKLLDEAQRHNKTMEAIAIGKSGSGLYLKRQRNNASSGYGLYLKQQSKN